VTGDQPEPNSDVPDAGANGMCLSRDDIMCFLI
jgi:hypothetical protein